MFITDEQLRDNVKEAARKYFDFSKSKTIKKDYIPVSGKVIEFEELSNMIDASLDMWLTSGRFGEEFETEFARFLGAKYALATNSGSSANLLALSALTSPKLGDGFLQGGDEVITVAAAFPTTIAPIIQNGLVPVFVDCELQTYNINASEIEKAISQKTKAIIIAHTLGNPFDLEKITDICRKHNLWLIEDSCDALGAEYNGQKTGTLGHIGTFSFYPAHHITMGEGGAVITNDPLLYKIIMSLRDWGRDCWCATGKDDTCKNRFCMQRGNLPFGYDHKYTYSHAGYNLKITDWQAAIGCAQLKKIEIFVEIRRKNFKFLKEKLSDLSEYIMLPQCNNKSLPSWFGFAISVRPNQKFNKLDLVTYLENNGVGTRQLFAGNILRHPMFVDRAIPIRIGDSALMCSANLSEKNYALLPNTDFIMNNTFWIGCHHGLEEEELDKISVIIHNAFGKYK
ncbi:MAG: lipopolysaccharide biosynthesis protein RfbH [Holosporaceae bacterium]|jgi:CDP-6-deoxy-D-xylo-4-hexulose-3-dehydrase|nr:lipopolysaccharide biosynthesis protein RfbH [Holosporaceae bacterium]